MAPTIPSAKLTLSYPLYGADFDPQNPGFLLVGGGGGESRSGVGNKITLLNASRKEELSEVVEIDLSRDEDSVTSLAVLQSSETSLSALAGINSSEIDQKQGKNEHLRSFRIDYPLRRQTDDAAAAAAAGDGDGEKPARYAGKTEALGQRSLFSKPPGGDDGLYQRIIRLSPSRNTSPRPVAAISTGLAAQGEIVVFRAGPSLKDADILGRIDLDKEEAADLDIWAGEEADTAVLSYCTSLSVFIYAISLSRSAALSEPIPIYTIPAPEAFKSPARPKLRALRFLSPQHVLLVANRPQRSGADLIVLKLDRLHSAGNSTLQKRLNKSIKAAVGLDVALLNSSPTGDRQILIAVAGQDGSIELLTMDYSTKGGLGRFKPYTVLRDVHPVSITKLAFSTFTCPPSQPEKALRNASIKLASVSVGQTVVVHTLSLRPVSSQSQTQSSSPSTPSPPPQYIVARSPSTSSSSSSTLQNTFSVFMAITVIGAMAFLLQAFVELRLGTNSGYLGASRWVSDELRQLIQRKGDSSSPSLQPNAMVDVTAGSEPAPATATLLPKLNQLAPPQDVAKISDLVAANRARETPHVLVIRSGEGEEEGAGLSAELHEPGSEAVLRDDGSVRRWDELSDGARRGWLTRLKEAGHWVEDQGEAVLKGILFTEVAGVVARVVAD